MPGRGEKACDSRDLLHPSPLRMEVCQRTFVPLQDWKVAEEVEGKEDQKALCQTRVEEGREDVVWHFSWRSDREL